METIWVKEIRAVYKGSRRKAPDLISSPQSLTEFIRRVLPDDTQEHFVVVNLDGAHCVSSYTVVSTGLANSSMVHPREVFKTAILSNAVAIICAHNHPSGEPVPSQADRNVTDRLKEAGEMLGIKVLDHVIIGADSFYSFVDQGLL